MEIRLHTAKPIVYTESRWHSETFRQGWESSKQEQEEFIETFCRFSRDIDMKITIRNFMYDAETIEPFRSMGLLRTNETKMPAWDIRVKERK